jgi:hypothetical protein
VKRHIPAYNKAAKALHFLQPRPHHITCDNNRKGLAAMLVTQPYVKVIIQRAGCDALSGLFVAAVHLPMLPMPNTSDRLSAFISTTAGGIQGSCVHQVAPVPHTYHKVHSWVSTVRAPQQ